jgi:hypothetical protein
VYHVLPNNLTTTEKDTVQGLPLRIIEALVDGDNEWQLVFESIPTVAGIFQVDLVRGTPGFEVYQRNITVDITNPMTGPVITLPVGSDQTIQPGDWLCQTGTTCVVPLPHELHALLAQRMVVKFLEAQGDQEQLAQSRQSLAEMAVQIPMLINPRAEGKPRKLANRLSLWRRWRW